MRGLINAVWIVLLLGSGLNSPAQGSVDFANTSTSRVTNFFTGEPVVVGTTFSAALYYAPDGVMDENVFVQLGLAASFLLPGRFAGGTRTTPDTTPPLGFAMFQVKAWETAFGSSYEEAVAAPPIDGRRALTGRSNVFRQRTTCDYCIPFPPPESLYEMQGFYVIPEPERAAFVLLGVALVALCLRFQPPTKNVTSRSRQS